MKTYQRVWAIVLSAVLIFSMAVFEFPVGHAAQHDHAGEQTPNYDLTQPFDQTYPELVQSEEVSYDEDTLLVKLPAEAGSAVTDAMAAVGVEELDELFALKDEIWFEAQLAQGTDLHAAVEALRAMDEVLLVDYNYHAEVAGMADPEEVPEDWLANPKTAEQWYLEYCGIPSGTALLDHPGGTSDVIVAVIDTGVDIDHEDLANNIWVNEYEIPGNGRDDDGNGYVDDYYGVNIVAGRGNGDDDNGHGTHVAGIIAAENNDIGVVGIAYNVKIMPIKASSAAGVFNQADIARAVLYAYAHGAHVINMSFGGPSCSVAVQDALSVAFTECVLVASAGNDGVPNEGNGAIPNYPAALTYVLGVMSVGPTGTESLFTNYDVVPHNAVEYEVFAPGESILSTIPNDGYASWSGTSMAAPVVAAMAALMRSQYPDTSLYSTRYIYGQLASASKDDATLLSCRPCKIANLYDALTNVPNPDVNMSDYALFDTVGLKNDADVNNGDGVIDSGETIALGFTLRNQWGQSKDTMVTIDTLSPAGIPDPYITILNDTVNYGAVGTYSEGDCGRIYTNDLFTAWENPFYIQIAENCPNNYWFNLNVTVSCGNGMDDSDTETYTTTDSILLLVRSGVVLPKIIDQDMTLSGDKLYIIPDATVIEYGATVTVEAGAHIQFGNADPGDPYAQEKAPGLTVKGEFLVEGTSNDMVYLHPCEATPDWAVYLSTKDLGRISLRYADITNLAVQPTETTTITKAEHCYFRQNTAYLQLRYYSMGTAYTAVPEYLKLPHIGKAVDCVFDRLSFPGRGKMGGFFDRCIFVDCSFAEYTEAFWPRNCLFLGNDNQWQHQIDDIPMNTPSAALNVCPIDTDLISFDKRDYAYREETDTTYVRVLPLSNVFGTNTVALELWHEWMGTNGLSIDTQEELDWFKSHFSIPYYELGEKRTEWMELPGYWSKEMLEEQRRLFHEEYLPAIYSENAILNRLATNFDPTHWMRVVMGVYSSGEEYDFSGNYWGTTNPELIEKQIIDYYDQPADLGKLIYEPYLTTPPENTFPFVTGITLFNKYGEEVTSVSNEEITFRVTFNRDMDTSIPLFVAYGPAEPYNDQTVAGHWVDARTWEGTKMIPTTIDGGYQYFRIANGCSAEDDLMLCTDTARFMFHVTQSAAQSMELQAEANIEGVKLSWMQDDFDTLMGYNVYRSTSEDGYYERINQTVIPSGTTEFLDENVQATTTYYYKFTVVKTDLGESEPSDVRSATAHQLTSRVTKKPTCTEPGTLTYTCMNCGKRFTEEIAPLGHEWGDWSVVQAPTTKEPGQEQRTCSTCGETESREIPMLEFIYGDTNGDGSINGKDLILLRQRLAGWTVTMDESAADCNGDGSINGKDLILLRQHLAGWDVVLGGG